MYLKGNMHYGKWESLLCYFFSEIWCLFFSSSIASCYVTQWLQCVLVTLPLLPRLCFFCTFISLFVFMRLTTNIVISKQLCSEVNIQSAAAISHSSSLIIYSQAGILLYLPNWCYSCFVSIFPLPCCNYRRFSKPKITLKHSSLPYFSQNAT